MSQLSVRGRVLLGGELVPGAVVVEQTRITHILRGAADDLPTPVLDAGIVAPGLIDLQVNGGFGAEVGDDADAIQRLSAQLPSTGVTSFLPTVITSPREFYERAFRAFDDAGHVEGAQPLGLHLEGPFISARRAGAHRVDLIESADPRLIDQMIDEPATTLVTLAPELPSAYDWIRRLRERGVVVSLGHTNATYEAFIAGVDAGATMATHIYNAMSAFAHRAPGAIGAALTDDRVTTGLIPDGVHSHPESVQLVIRAKGADRVAVVTDMMSATGMPPGEYELGGRKVVVDGISARLENGTLAGSILTMDQALRNLVRWSVPVVDALRMTSEVPANVLGLTGKGRIVVGADADLVLFDDQLNVTATIVGGDVMYDGSPETTGRMV